MALQFAPNWHVPVQSKASLTAEIIAQETQDWPHQAIY